MDTRIPSLVLEASVSNIIEGSPFPFDDGSGDLWWLGGAQATAYQWTMDITVTPQLHSAHLTRKQFEYNGLDIFVGDWIANTGSAKALEIISVESKTTNTATIFVQDTFRYNQFADDNQVGFGRFNVGPAVIFRISEEGMPLIDPIPPTISQLNFAPQLTARFRKFNKLERFPLEKSAHTFQVGDLIAISDAGVYELSDNSNRAKLLGSVIDIGPGSETFSITPITKVIENHQPGLPGSRGDFLYVDPSTPGQLTDTTTGSSKPVFIKITEPVPTVLNGSVLNPTTSIGTELEINGITVTFTGTTLTQTVIDINGTGGHFTVAAPGVSPTIAETVFASTGFGLVAGGPPFSATINGSLVSFSTTASGGAFADEIDIAFDINLAAIPFITASASAGKLRIEHSLGSAITIVNILSGTFGQPFAGALSITGISLFTAASTDVFLQLTQADGLGILVENITNDPFADFGIFSVQNGRLPLGMVVEQSIRKGEIFVVADIATRDALTVLIGDMVFVLNTGEGEWGLFIWDSSSFEEISNQDAAATDAQSVAIPVTFATANGAIDIHRVSPGSRVTSVLVDVTIAFDGVGAQISVGDAGDNSRLMEIGDNDLAVVGTYETTPSFQFSGPNETEVKAFFNKGTATQGAMIVTISYV